MVPIFFSFDRDLPRLGKALAEISFELILAAIAIATAGGSFVSNHYRSVLQVNARFAKLENILSTITVKVDIWWRMVEENVPKMVMRPTHKRMDQLLEKFRERTITSEEIVELKPMIQDLLLEDLNAKNGQADDDMKMLMLIEYRQYEMNQPSHKEGSGKEQSRRWF